MARTRSLRSRSMTVIVALAVLAGGLLGVTMAWALFSATSAAEANSFTADALPQGNTPSASVSPANGATVTITFAQAVTTTGQVAIPAANYTLTRYPAAGGSAVVISNNCVLGGSSLTCTDTPGDGTWQYTDTPTYGTNWVGMESAKSGTVLVDTTGPTVSAPIVGSPHSYVNGITYVNNGVGLTDTASDAGSGVKSITYYWCTGSIQTCTSANGTQIGLASTSPYPVTWSSQPADAAYTIVAVGLDNVGNTTTSSPTFVTVDNTPPTVSTPSVNGIS